MTTNKLVRLLYFLLCFCFLSTSYAQTCLSEINLSSGAYSQIELEDNHEPIVPCSRLTNATTLENPRKIIAHGLEENVNPQPLPCCNRGPPTHSTL